MHGGIVKLQMEIDTLELIIFQEYAPKKTRVHLCFIVSK